MRVIMVEPQRGELVTIEGTDYGLAVRYSADHWMLLMGESYEPVFAPDDLEAAYQQYQGRQR